MTKKIKAFKRLLLAIFLITGIILSTISFTKAYFFDVEQSSGNLFATEIVNLQVGESDPSIYNFSFVNLRPGIVFEDSVAISSLGGYSGNFSLEISHANSLEGDNSEPETDVEGEGELDDCVEMRIMFDNGSVNEEVLFDWSSLAEIENVRHNEGWLDGQIDYWVNTGVANMIIQARTDNCANDSMGDSFLMNLAFYLDQV